MVMARKMIFGIQVPSTGGRLPDTENTVEICWKKIKVKAKPIPMKR